MERTISRSSSRLSHLKSIMKLHDNHSAETTSMETTMVASPGLSYLMEVYVGTPPVKQMMYADMGSSVSWIQCLPCENCFHQALPIFNPYASASSQILLDSEHECMLLEDKRDLTKSNGVCNYAFGGNSYTRGVLFKETYTLGPTSITHVALGCGHDNVGQYEQQCTGIIGLADSPLSFIGQTDAFLHGRFTYCLVSDQFGSNPDARTSKISFGHSPEGTISTWLWKMRNKPNYYIILKSFIIGDTVIPMGGLSANFMLDTGSTLSYLPTKAYEILVDALIKRIGKRPFYVGGELCYKINTSIPIITLQFDNGPELVLSKKNTFIKYDENKMCLAIKPDDVLSILGNRAQIDFSIGIDIHRRMVSFDPTDCSTHVMP
ncbi:aspartic proteinase CDR1-like [Impatiens glandulifera]|uniref:aspartic proteinase CDR1-like n=1 Tax=Impatiens glandulifera TaxID=253017 RepID=UPI001FB136CF|nr:aspartic proteinase CDR1-like [Impatiens glandulifera]